MFQLVDFVGSWWSLWVPVLLVAGPGVRVISSEARAWVAEVREWVRIWQEGSK